MRIGTIGFGYWGPNLVRNFSGLEGVSVCKVADTRTERGTALKKLYPAIEFTNDPYEIINDPGIDAVIIATPVFTHYELAMAALRNGKHVMVEKPMSSTSAQAAEMIELAEQKGRVLMVDHTYLYTGAVKKMKELVVSGSIGNARYLDSTRINLGLFQPDINVIWDLAPHDISILTYLINDDPYSVQATGVSHTNNGIENIGYLNVNYESGFNAHFNCSWTSPVKIRMLLIGGDKKMIVFNDLEPTEKVKVYDTGYVHNTDEERNRVLVDYRTGDIYIPKLDTREALSLMANDFVSAVSSGTKPLSDANLGLKVIKILEASQSSIKNRGRETKIG